MKNFLDDKPELFEAFIKSVQYNVSLKTQQDTQDHLGRFITTYLPAYWTAFVERDSLGGISIHSCTLPDTTAVQHILTDEVRILIADVLDSGFLASQVIFTPAPSMTVFLPIVEESRLKGVMLVGHETTESPPNELLNIYLAIAGLAGATFERLNYERELNMHRVHLEELVKERTLELQTTNERLELEITERKRAEEALHAERERLAVTLGSIGDGVIATDIHANVVLINQVAQDLTGWTQGEAEGKHFLEVFNIINENTGEPAEDPVGKALKTGLVVGLANHTALIARDGSKRSIADSCAPIRDMDGNIIGAVLVFRDVTEQKRAEELRDALNKINSAINSTLDFDEIMQRVVIKAAETLGCSTSSIEIRKEGYWKVRYLYGLPEEMLGTRFTFEETVGLEIMVKTKKPFVISGDIVNEILSPKIIEAYKVKSMLLMPIVVRGEVVAAMRFVYQDAPIIFTGAQVDFASQLGASVSLALENARLYEAERNIADTLQSALLNMPEYIKGLEFGYLYRSATEAAQVGGDFFDLFELGQNMVGIVLGDVSGKGIKAAALTAVARNTIRAYALDGYSPAEVITRSNNAVHRVSDVSSFITVFFGILDTKTGRLAFCSAGHPPAIIKRETGSIDLLLTDSPLIGAFPNMAYNDAEVVLDKNDMLILYTDGIIEARCDGDLYGEGQLVRFIKDLRPIRIAEVPQAIFDDVANRSNGKFSDDMAMLAVAFEDHTHRS